MKSILTWYEDEGIINLILNVGRKWIQEKNLKLAQELEVKPKTFIFFGLFHYVHPCLINFYAWTLSSSLQMLIKCGYFDSYSVILKIHWFWWERYTVDC